MYIVHIFESFVYVYECNMILSDILCHSLQFSIRFFRLQSVNHSIGYRRLHIHCTRGGRFPFFFLSYPFSTFVLHNNNIQCIANVKFFSSRLPSDFMFTFLFRYLPNIKYPVLFYNKYLVKFVVNDLGTCEPLV